MADSAGAVLRSIMVSDGCCFGAMVAGNCQVAAGAGSAEAVEIQTITAICDCARVRVCVSYMIYYIYDHRALRWAGAGGLGWGWGWTIERWICKEVEDHIGTAAIDECLINTPQTKERLECQRP